MARKKICRCGKLISYKMSRCPDCEKKHIMNIAQKNRIYDTQNRDLHHTQFYKSKEWRTLSVVIRNKYNGLCLRCYIENKIINEADVVHHIDELSNSWDRRLDCSNLIPLCHNCHNKLEKGQYNDETKAILYKYLSIWHDIMG